MLNPILKEKLLIDLSCGLYILFLAPIVKHIVEDTVYGWGNAEGAGILAAVLLLFNVMEVFAISPFISQILHSIEDKNIRLSKQTSLILLFFLHAAVTLSIGIFAFQLFGYTFDKHALLLSIVIILILAKEVFLLSNCLSETPKTLFTPTVGKWIIALYSCFIITIFMDANHGNASPNIPMLMLNLIAMGIFFAFFYYPMRLPYTFYSVVYKTNTNDKFIEFASFLIVFLPYAFRKL